MLDAIWSRRPDMRPPAPSGSVAFLFFGELFLIPHLLPIAAALAREPNPPRITLFVITSVHEEIVREAVDRLRISGVRIRRARRFLRLPLGVRETRKLPWKPMVLALNALAILRHDVAVVAERTSLWLPRLSRFGARFIYNEHGAGPHANFASKRNRYAARILMPGNGMAERCREGGDRDAPIEVVGYIKRDYMRELAGSSSFPKFPARRPTVIYVPHWLRHKSSWWGMGEQVLEYFARSARYNLVLAPHIRLPEHDPEFQQRVARFRKFSNIHIDAGSFALVDQSYINEADIYLGCGSSQIIEFAERPRPVILLNSDRIDWRADPRFSHWQMGDVVNDIHELDRALAAAFDAHASYLPVQRTYVASMMGKDDGCASMRAAAVVRQVLAEQCGGDPKLLRPVNA
jgi:hypothetical protein